MSYRYDDLVPGEIYHVFTRGVEKREIFRHNADRTRFIELLLHSMPNQRIISYSQAKKLKHDMALTRESDGLIDLLAYCLMPNHFHLLVKENVEHGISRYIHRLLTAYARYFNISEQRSGSLFVNPFRAVLVDGDKQLLQVSRYIHLNPLKAKMITRLFDYEWSSLGDYMGDSYKKTCHTSTLGDLLKPVEHKEFLIDEVDYIEALSVVPHLLIDNEV